MIHIIIATRNHHKFSELRELLPKRGIRWHSLGEFPNTRPVRENGASFKANAVKKARAVAKATGCIALADDSGLEVDALGGDPGIHSARYAGRHGDDAANNRKLLRALKGLPTTRRRARYCCVLAIADSKNVLAAVEGRWIGRIAETPAGRAGFGYDPIFWLPKLRKTVAQLPRYKKRRLSHRAAAARRLWPILQRLSRSTARR